MDVRITRSTSQHYSDEESLKLLDPNPYVLVVRASLKS
jgi:hypothetical protein